MFSKIWTSALLVAALSLQVQAHAGVSPALGVTGTLARSDVKRPSTASPCGAGVNIASALGTSTAVKAAADGTFTATVTNFNGGADGSRKVTAAVDATGAGTKFVAATVSTNGDAAPAAVGSQQIVASLPAGTTCSGGTGKNLCLVQFKTTAGFGNCVAVSQAAAAAGNAAAAGTAAAATDAAATDATAATAAATPAASTAATTGATTGRKGKGKGRKAAAAAAKAATAKAAGTRSARAILAEIEARGEEAVEVVRRGVMSWIWA